MKKITSYLIFTVILVNTLFSTGIIAEASAADWPEEPQISSQNVILIDADTGNIIYEKNAYERCYPASTANLLTGLVAVENSSLSDTVTFTKDAVNSLEYGDSSASIVTGEQMSVEQSLYCLFLRSGCDAAYGIAEHSSGSLNAFLKLMNDKAKALGALNSNFTNAAGKYNKNNYSTPYDMSLIARACYNNQTIMDILSYSDVYKIAPTNKNTFTRYYKSSFQMFPDGSYEYEYALAGKSGGSEESGSCLVSFAKKDDLSLICVVMNSTENDRYSDSIKLFSYVFNNFKKLYVSEYESGISFNSLEIFDVTGSLLQDGNFNIKFNDNAYALVPKDISFYDLSSIMTYADSDTYTGDSSGFANIHYFFNDRDVGVATIYINENNGSFTNIGTNGVPSVTNEKNNTANSYIIINIWYIVGGLLITIAIIAFIVHNFKKPLRNYYKKNKMRR